MHGMVEKQMTEVRSSMAEVRSSMAEVRTKNAKCEPEDIAAADGDDGNNDVEQQGRLGPDEIGSVVTSGQQLFAIVTLVITGQCGCEILVHNFETSLSSPLKTCRLPVVKLKKKPESVSREVDSMIDLALLANPRSFFDAHVGIRTASC